MSGKCLHLAESCSGASINFNLKRNFLVFCLSSFTYISYFRCSLQSFPSLFPFLCRLALLHSFSQNSAFFKLEYARNISHHNENTQSVWQSMQVRADGTLKKKSKGIRLLQNSDEFVQTVGSGFWDAIKKECDQRKFSINYRKCMQNPNAWFYENIPMELFRSIISRTI